MGVLEILVIIGCCLIVGGVIAKSIIDKKKGKKSCGCGCADCSKCHLCNRGNKEDNKKS